ncbi:putative bifunctional diguanylate cyclase/phosphodiesterase [Dactylosporangium sp. NPDC000521]|uniref:putative bifunctional diguanylate cyclase/phosphodiesterase n=1 Tax=Dactylosporangium sp. NPDC000521 TaxID=3363975 RepID=UPI0036C65E5F
MRDGKLRVMSRPLQHRARAAGGATLASAVLAAFAVSVFAVNLSGPRTPLVLLWLAAPVSVVIPVLAAARITRAARFPAPTRRFWRHLATCAALAGIGVASNARDALGSDTASQDLSPVTVATYSSAVLTLLWGLWRLPLGTTSRGDRMRIGMDAGTVLVAATVFMWHYQTRPLLEAGNYRAPSLIAASFTLVLELLAVFAIAKVALSGHRFVARGALHLFAAGMVAGALSGFLQRLIVDKPHLGLSQITVPLVMICATAAARRQWQASTAPGRRCPAGTRPSSNLPYLAVAAVDTLLLVTIFTDDGDERLAAVAAVALTALVVWRQITVFRENARLVARLDHNATHDALTQLPNRALFNETLAAALSSTAAGHRHGVSVALVDLDDFKTVNDTLGHAAGDALLLAVAQRLVSAVRPGDVVARLGGDEFVVILDDVTPAGAEQVARRMIAALGEPVVADGHELLVRASIGIAGGRSGDDAGDLLRRADIAMYAAKHGGGSSCLSYTDGMAGAVAGSAALGAQLRQAVDNGELFVEYQPIVSLDNGRMTAVEALVRWAHPTRGTLPPAEFIPVAERTGLIVAVGELVLREACRQLARWSAEHGQLAPAAVNVNVSARQLAEPSFADRVAAALTETGLAPHRLTLEITESTAVALGDAVAHLEALRRLGVRVALDDFGTDQSSLTLLQNLPVDEIKLDRSFVQRLASGRAEAMPAAVLALARVVGLDVVAEGVEVPEQAQQLATLGYRTAQGYHFARPMPADAVDRLLTAAPVAGAST